MALFTFGSGLLYGTRTDVATQTPQRFGALQDVSIEFSADTKELFGQNAFPLDVAGGKKKISGKAKMAQISGSLFNSLFFGGTLGTGSTLSAYQETATIPSSTPWQVTVSNSATFKADLGVRFASTGLPLASDGGSPAAGQYSCNTATGVYTFSTSDANKAVLIDYSYTSASTGQTMTLTNPLMGFAPRFSAFFSNKYNNQSLQLTLNACVATKLTFATKLDDYAIPEFDFSAYGDAAGNVFTLTVTDLG